ncbi:hypothetical protein IP84_03720 [beta proteobacterium AAP99]|nr:hypothetical protein IP84_03720 [beta proteobacterium AAP99]
MNKQEFQEAMRVEGMTRREWEIRRQVRRQAAWWREAATLLTVVTVTSLINLGAPRMIWWAQHWIWVAFTVWGVILLGRGLVIFWLPGLVGGPDWEERKVSELMARREAARVGAPPADEPKGGAR